MRLLAACLALALALPSASPARADDTAAAIAHWQEREARLFTIGWKLAAGNAPFCKNTKRAAGWLLHDAATYSDAEGVRRALSLKGDIAVQAVASGSPADKAGLRTNDALDSINEHLLHEYYPVSEPRWKRLQEVREAVDTELSISRPAITAWITPEGETRVAEMLGTPVCATTFELSGSGKGAVAEGSRVIFGQDFPGFAYPDAEFAAAIAHELAHNVLQHRAWLDAAGRKQGNVRATEKEADRLMPWLLANAGYPPEAARDFMAKWGPRHAGGLLRKRTHDGWDERVEFIEAEIALIRPLLEQTGRADWSRHFVRETAPAIPPQS